MHHTFINGSAIIYSFHFSLFFCVPAFMLLCLGRCKKTLQVNDSDSSAHSKCTNVATQNKARNTKTKHSKREKKEMRNCRETRTLSLVRVSFCVDCESFLPSVNSNLQAEHMDVRVYEIVNSYIHTVYELVAVVSVCVSCVFRMECESISSAFMHCMFFDYHNLDN